MSRAGVILAGGTTPVTKAVADRLSDAGFEAVVLDNPQAPALAPGSGNGFVMQQPDLLDADSTRNALERAIATVGELRALVCCTTDAAAGEPTLQQQSDFAEYHRIIERNVIGVFNLIRLVAAHMSRLAPDEDGQRGVIITNGYARLDNPPAGVVAYAASMGCVRGMTLAIARDLAGLGIRICSIDTDVGAIVPEDFAAMALHIIENHMLNGTGIALATASRMK